MCKKRIQVQRLEGHIEIVFLWGNMYPMLCCALNLLESANPCWAKIHRNPVKGSHCGIGFVILGSDVLFSLKLWWDFRWVIMLVNHESSTKIMTEKIWNPYFRESIQDSPQFHASKVKQLSGKLEWVCWRELRIVMDETFSSRRMSKSAFLKLSMTFWTWNLLIPHETTWNPCRNHVG